MIKALMVGMLMGFPMGVSAQGGGGYIQEFYQARKQEATDPKAAEEGMRRSFRLAVEAGNGDYATAAGLSACFLIFQRGAVVETGKFAAEVIEGLAPLDVEGPHGDAARRATLFGFVERGLLMEGKIGEGWRVNRLVAETLRGKKVDQKGDGKSITVAEVMGLAGGLKDAGWRLIEREAEYLGLAGRTVEALAMLDEAAERMGPLAQMTPVARFYPFKVLVMRAEVTDFLGDHEAGLARQRELLALPGEDAAMRRSLAILEMNFLRNLSKWEGPSEANLAAARRVGDRLKAMGAGRGVDQLLAKMEVDLKDSEQALAVMAAGTAKEVEMGHLLQALYFERDAVVRRARRGEKALDGEFAGLLAKARAQGNKRSEPNLYREYADYLLEDGRAAEAAGMLVEALRLCRSFGWYLHEPPILTNLFQARLMAGDRSGAEAVLAELTAWLERHPDAPISRRSPAMVGRILGLAQLGQAEAARRLLVEAREAAAGLPEHRRQWLSPEREAALLAPRAEAPAAVAAQAELRVHPWEIGSVAVPGGLARTRFAVWHPGGAKVAGHWQVSGPGASYDAAREVVEFAAGAAVASVTIPQALAAGEEAFLAARIRGAEAVEASQIRIGWVGSDGVKSPESLWQVSWDAAASGRVVMDASRLEANPFRSVSVFHELSMPAGETRGVAVRVRSAVPLRFEYYQPESGQLLGIDANGNGRFDDAGDWCFGREAGAAGAWVSAKGPEAATGVEVRIYSTEGGGPLLVRGGQRLQVEVWRDGEWVLEAEDELK